MGNTTATILIVDDEPLNLEIIEAHLETDDYHLIKAGDGEQAWSLLQANPEKFDVIILDRMMPRDGAAHQYQGSRADGADAGNHANRQV